MSCPHPPPHPHPCHAPTSPPTHTRNHIHRSSKFQGIFGEITGTLNEVYNSHKAIVMPGSGTFAMESVARQLGTDEKVMVLRNGFFSYRWSHIFEMGKIPSEEIVLKAAPQEGGDGHPQYVDGGTGKRGNGREGRQRDGGREREGISAVRLRGEGGREG